LSPPRRTPSKDQIDQANVVVKARRLVSCLFVVVEPTVGANFIALDRKRSIVVATGSTAAIGSVGRGAAKDPELRVSRHSFVVPNFAPRRALKQRLRANYRACGYRHPIPAISAVRHGRSDTPPRKRLEKHYCAAALYFENAGRHSLCCLVYPHAFCQQRTTWTRRCPRLAPKRRCLSIA
jgi:hypothetical protein